jgi:hypothetical protein
MGKEQKQTTIIICCCVLMVALVALILWRMYKKRQQRSQDVKPDAFPLKEGSLGDEVFSLQNALNAKLRGMTIFDELELQELKADGIFGKKTRQACLLVLGTESVSKEQFTSLTNDI